MNINIDLDKMIEIRKWGHDEQQEYLIIAELSEVINNPHGYNFADLGFHLVNQIRKELGIPELSYQLLAK